MPEKIIHIFIDDREKNQDVIAELRLDLHVDITITRLSVGDYQINNQWLFERKTLADFAKSIIDGRLFDQVEKLSHSVLLPVLILEGTAKDLLNSQLSRESMQGALIWLTIFFRIPLLRAKNAGETAKLMLYTARQSKRVHRNTIARAGYRPKGKRKWQLYLLQGLPGIGPVRAKQLLAKFGSVEKIMLATPAELMQIPGIGNYIVKKIHWVVK